MRQGGVWVRVEEHQKDQRAAEGRHYTRKERSQSVTEMNKSAITDHTVQENHVIDWEGTRVVDRESHAMSRRVKEAIWIRREGDTMNRDEGAYQLSGIYNGLIRSRPGLCSSAGSHSLRKTATVQ